MRLIMRQIYSGFDERETFFAQHGKNGFVVTQIQDIACFAPILDGIQ